MVATPIYEESVFHEQLLQALIDYLFDQNNNNN